MKKNILFSISLLAPFLVFADMDDSTKEVSMSCVQVIQTAINPQGECREFSTPCDVPEGWKMVNSCSYFAEKENKTDIEDATNRRHKAKWKALREKAKINAEAKEPKNPTSRGFLRQSNRYVRNSSAQEDTSLARKTSTSKKWGSTFRKLVSPVRQKALDKQAEINEIKEKAKNANRLRKIPGSATQAIRTGKLSSHFWSTAQKARDKRQETSSTSSETIKKALRSRQPFRKKKAPNTNKIGEKSLTRIYRGKSIRGNIEGIK